MDSIIAGLLPYPPNILVLCYTSLTPPSTPSGSDVDFHRRIATRPELRIISPEQEELSSDALSLKDHARLQPNDYALHWNKKAKCVYIVSPSDIVVGRERTAEDRVQWLLERGKYREALEVFESSAEGEGHVLGKWNRKEIGVKYIEHLIEEGIFPKPWWWWTYGRQMGGCGRKNSWNFWSRRRFMGKEYLSFRRERSSQGNYPSS